MPNLQVQIWADTIVFNIDFDLHLRFLAVAAVTFLAKGALDWPETTGTIALQLDIC